ncbi:MAG: carboxypeptidase-like regulatory domain-containing protein, partial [Actinomycetota bacterium]|nr:carboxypeptidase-like regulatory domain-containing protein [Actinomycetota bacterium]
MATRSPLRAVTRAALAFALALLALAAPAAASVQNLGFEDGLAGWTATKAPGGGGYYGPPPGPPEPADCRVPDGVCVIGGDSFTTSGGYGPSESHEVAPVEGTKMLRLGGPFTSASQPQKPELYRVEQTFTVAPGETLIELAYNAFTWDVPGYDELVFRVTLTDEDGDVLAERKIGSFGEGGRLRTTGWRPVSIDLAGYEGRQVTLRIHAGGTRDSTFGFWAYVDLGTNLPDPPVGTPDAGPVTKSDGTVVPSNEQVDPATGLWWLSVSPSSNACESSVPISVPIDPGAGTVSNVQLLLQTGLGTGRFAMTDGPPADGVWQGVVNCMFTGQLYVEYTLTEDGQSQTFVIPIGGLTVIDPQGVVYDQDQYDAARANGATEAAARTAAAIAGATVRLQREVDGTFVNVLSGDPGIMPKMNPQVTGANGLFQWDVSVGRYRVVVTKAGYDTVTSRAVDIPPPVLDLHVPMRRTQTGGGGGGGGGGGEP